MGEQQTTGIKSADEMIEQARADGITVSIERSEREQSATVRVEFRYVVPEHATGTHLGQIIGADYVAAVWFKSSSKGARWSMLTAARWELSDHTELKRVKDVRVQLDAMGREAARLARDEEQRQQARQPVEGAEHYVTVNDGARISNALGPYLTEEGARANVGRVREFLDANDPSADAYEYGVFRVRGYGRKLGAGRLNARIGLTAPVVEEQPEERPAVEGLPTGEAFAHAVRTARAAGPIMRDVVKPEAWCGHVIVRRAGEAYSVYPESAWVEPTERPVLPWSAPVGERVAVVALDGSVSVWEQQGGEEAPVCGKCGRERRPWPVERPVQCSPKRWAYCIRPEAVSGPGSAGEQPGAGAVPATPGAAREGTWGVLSDLLGDEERATVDAERLVPRGARLTVRVVEGAGDVSAVEERAYVVGVVAAQLRAGARHSEGRGSLVLRWETVTTLVSLAA